VKTRKLSANYIFDGTSRFLKNGILTLTEKGQVISLTDTGGDLKEEAGLEHYNGIICPGFVNAHCHLELSHMRGMIPKHTGLPGFVEWIITSRKSSPAEISEAIIAADREMQSEGIVAVGDISNTSDTFETKSQSKLWYYNFIEIFGTSAASAQEIFRNGQNLHRLAVQKYGLKAGITPHASYSSGEELFALIRDNAEPGQSILSVHNQETISEDELVKNGSGELFNTFVKLGFDMSSKTGKNVNSLQWLLCQLPKGKRILLIHNLYTGEQDIRDSGAANEDIYWVLCPLSNYYIGGIYPGKHLIDRFPERICIGTDSLSSNDKLSILDELFALQSVHPSLTLKDLLRFSCSNGAKALGVDKWCGSFGEGMNPGVILIENADLQQLILKENSKVRVLAGIRG
jgi:aminodeoxyfutalosine deaminase